MQPQKLNNFNFMSVSDKLQGLGKRYHHGFSIIDSSAIKVMILCGC
jgi:hypothetical protein